MEDDFLPRLGTAAYICEEGELAVLDITRHLINKGLAKCPFVADGLHQGLVGFVGPIPFPIGAGTEDVVGHPPLAQGMGEAVEKD